jgi:hypothetical protein
MRGTIAALFALTAFGLIACASQPTGTQVASSPDVRTVKYRGATYTVETARDSWRVSPTPYPYEAASTRSAPSLEGPTIAAAAAAKPKACTAKLPQSDGRTFHGSAREVPKTTIPEATIEYFSSVTALRKDIRANSDDLDMIDSGISTRCDEARVDSEKRVVMVLGYLYAAKKEADNDYHLILGTKNCKNADCFMTAEVSGVPRLVKDRTNLAKARDDFEDQIADFTPSGGMPGDGAYLRFQPPIPVRVTGPLFYDADHKIKRDTREGAVGPSYARPSTSWEIHPVVRIEFEPTSNGVPLTIARLH